jgi:phospholipid/cholesterol/gamma-HCH transport system substrate-binding protein
LAKLEDAIEQLRDMFTRINKGEGSVGMLINDPTYAEELKEALKNVNKLLSKTGGVKFVVDMGAQEIAGYGSGRGWFKLQIWPDPTRYYLLGIGVDPRGKRTVVNTTTTAGGLTATTQTVTVEESGLLLTGMLGKVLWNRLELAAGVLHSDAAATVGIWVGPHDHENTIQFYNDVYSRGKDFGIDYRFTTVVRPWSIVYLQAGVESIHRVDNKIPLFVGAGVSFDDDVIKLLFALR